MNHEKSFEFNPAQLVESFVRIGKELVLRPRIFFHTLPLEGNMKSPLFFLLICIFLSSLFVATTLRGDYHLFFVLIVANICSAFVGSLLLHGIATKAFKSHAPFEATFRIIAYASLVDIAAWVPILGIIASLYGLYLIYLGLQEMHQLKPQHAGITVGIITLMLFFGQIMAAFMLKNSLSLPQYGL